MLFPSDMTRPTLLVNYLNMQAICLNESASISMQNVRVLSIGHRYSTYEPAVPATKASMHQCPPHLIRPGFLTVHFSPPVGRCHARHHITRQSHDTVCLQRTMNA